MKKIKTILSLILVISFALFACIGCAETETKEFTYSDGIDENGFWKDITAIDNVELCEYKGMTIPQDVHEISDEAVETEIDGILANFSYENQITDRVVADGDTVNIDYVGSIDGVNFEGGSTDGQGANVTIGVTNYIDDFLAQLIGHSPGESFDIEVTFPEDYGKEELNGKDAVFAVTLNYIVENVTPELTDDFVVNNFSSRFDFKTVAGMKEYVKDNMQHEAIAYYVQDYIFENTTINSLPDDLVKYQENLMVKYYKSNAENYGVEFEEFLNTYMGVSTTEELLEANHDNNKKNAEYYLILQAIAEDADISVTDEDLTAYFTEYFGTEDHSEFEETYGIPYLKLTSLHQSVLDYVVDNSVME